MLHNHPLDQLIHDDSLFFLEAMIPFVDYAYKKPLILLIKYQEIRALMQCFDHPDYVASCGFDCHPESSEERWNACAVSCRAILQAISRTCSRCLK